MRTIILEQPGAVENLKLTDTPKPSPKSGEVLVQVKAISVNPVDAKTRAGKAMYEQLAKDKPVILGWDIAGEVTAVGENVDKFKTGDAVFGMVNFPGHGKAYAEYVAAPADDLAHKPENVSFQQAAATTLAALTAWQVLTQQARLQSGERVLIHAASGGVGHFAVQIAKHIGAYVIGTASEANADFLKELGVDEHIDYKKVKFEEAVKDIDVVLDTIGGDNTTRSFDTVKQGGRLITIAGSIDEEKEKLAKEKDIKAERYMVHSSSKDMEQLATLMQSGEIRPYIYKEYALEDMQQAHQQIETGKTKGKIVVIP